MKTTKFSIATSISTLPEEKNILNFHRVRETSLALLITDEDKKIYFPFWKKIMKMEKKPKFTDFKIKKIN